MPRRNGHVPAFRLHKPSGQAGVIISGEHVYLGRYGSPESPEKYARLVSELPAAKSNGRQSVQNGPNPTLSINELLRAYSQFAQSYYVKDGKPMASQLVSPKTTSPREFTLRDIMVGIGVLGFFWAVPSFFPALTVGAILASVAC